MRSPDLWKFIRLTGKILRYGRFSSSGADFSALRRQALEPLLRYCPPSFRTKYFSQARSAKRPGFWRGQFAYLKNAFSESAGHLCYPQKGLCYIRIPRAGSTAFSRSVLQARYKDLEMAKLDPETVNFLADANMETAAGSPHFFTAVRNPFARIVSFYRGFFEKDTTRFIYADYLFGIFRKDMSFRDFIANAAAIPDVLKDQHIRPQHLFLLPYKRKGCRLTVLKVEDTGAASSFCTAHGLSLSRFNFDDRQYDYRRYYDEKLVETVRRMYSVDITLGGYEGDYRALLEFVRSGTAAGSRKGV